MVVLLQIYEWRYAVRRQQPLRARHQLRPKRLVTVLKEVVDDAGGAAQRSVARSEIEVVQLRGRGG